MRYTVYLHQHAYQTGRSVMTTLHSLVSYERVFEEGPVGLGALLDIEGTSDTISPCAGKPNRM
jgi:hypothetical protein